MEAKVTWIKDMSFKGEINDYEVHMDATGVLGHQDGPNPKELFLASIAGCAGMDVIGILKKSRKNIERLEISAMANGMTEDYPVRFKSIDLLFDFRGILDYETVFSAVEKSQTMYSGISAMVCETVPIRYIVFVDGQKIGDGRANFDRSEGYFQTAYEG